jgi:glyoxylase-like metal-dependent hydrolase (beta-lactamase superfamily II)
MPISLDHINLWLLEDGDGWTVVDTCLATDDARALWETLFAGFMGGRPVTRVICTHMHPDHVGLAGWLCERFDCALWMTRSEYLMCRSLVADTGREAPKRGAGFLSPRRLLEEQLDRYAERFGFFGMAVSTAAGKLSPPAGSRDPDHRRPLLAGDGGQRPLAGARLPLLPGPETADRRGPGAAAHYAERVRVSHGARGRSPEMAALLSSARLRERLPEDLLVLPAHEAPFLGLHVRLSQLIDGHERDLGRLFDHLDTPRRAVDCFSPLFSREIGAGDFGLATGETLAHLNCLLGRRRVRRITDDEGVYRYVQDPDTVGVDEDIMAM